MAKSRYYLALLLLLIVSACRKQEAPTVQYKPLPVQLVFNAEVEPLVVSLANEFAQTPVLLPNRMRVQLELVKENPAVAAQRIAKGDIKGHLWLAPSTALVNYANANIVNLGARQTECTPLFTSPLVAVAKNSQSASLGATNQTIRFASLLDARGPDEAPISVSHGIPGTSEAGLGAVAQLRAYRLAKAKGGEADDLELLAAVEKRVANYSEDEQYLIDRLSTSPLQSLSVVLTSEQQYVKYVKAHAQAAISPLYFDEPTYSQDYQLCVSAADWVTPAHKAAIDIIKKATLSAGIQQQALSLGFRPVSLGAEGLSSYRVRSNVQLKQLPSSEGSIVSTMIDQWESLSRPLAITLLVQTSLSFPAEVFSVVQNSLHHFLSNKKSATRVSILGYSGSTRVYTFFSTNNAELASQMTLLQPQSGEVLYDGLRKAFESALDEQSVDYRRKLVIITTGKDNGSQADFDGLLSYATNRLSKTDLDVIALVTAVDGQNSSEFEQIIRQVGGSVRSLTRDNVFDLLRAVF